MSARDDLARRWGKNALATLGNIIQKVTSAPFTLPPLEPGEEPDMSYVRHLREATTELARHDTKVDVRDRWGPQKPLPSAEKRHPPGVLAVAKARKRRARLVKYK